MVGNEVFFVIGIFTFSVVLMNFMIYKKILGPMMALEKKGFKVTGTLLRVDRVKKSKSVAYYAVVRYKTMSGQNHEGRSLLSIRKYLRDENVPMEIIYNPDKENEFMPVEFFNLKIYKRIMIFSNVMSVGMLVFILFQTGVLKF